MISPSSVVPNVQLVEAIKAFENHDWREELRKYVESEEEKCDPGFGIVAEHSILHICPINEHTCYVYYHYSTKKKLLGLIPITSDMTHTIDKISMTKAKWLIECHYSGKEDNILKT